MSPTAIVRAIYNLTVSEVVIPDSFTILNHWRSRVDAVMLVRHMTRNNKAGLARPMISMRSSFCTLRGLPNLSRRVGDRSHEPSCSIPQNTVAKTVSLKK
jgi:hypothetical protein